MALKEMYEGCKTELNWLLNHDFNLHLFTNDIEEITVETTLDDLVEATFDNYSPIGYGGSVSWTPAIIKDGKAICYGSNAIFFCDGNSVSELIYGYFWTNSDNSVLIAAEIDEDGPFPINEAGDFYQFVPTWNLQSEY
jgi:hypothetical protein